MLRRVAILGSTGSIGKNALRVIDALNSSIIQHPTSNVERRTQGNIDMKFLRLVRTAV